MQYKFSKPHKRAFATEEFVPTGVWTAECTEAYNRLKQTQLFLHPYEGWKFAGDFNFLRDLWRIESFRLFNTNETDLTPLYEKQELEKVEFLRVRIAKKHPGFDLARFPKLKVLSVRWMPGISNLEKATRLEYLEVWGFTGTKHWDLTMMPTLATLDVHGARGVESLDLRGLPKLQSLTLQVMPKLVEIHGVNELKVTPATWIHINGSKKLSPGFLRRFDKAGFVSFQGKLIVKDGMNVRPWPDELG
jgi:hypothetical protein